MGYINNIGIFQNFRTMGIVTQDTKPTIFQSSTFFTGRTILIKA